MTETTKAKWRGRVREWKASGRTLAEFTKGREFTAATLRWWAYKLGAEAKKSSAGPTSTPPITLLPVRRTTAPSGGIVLELGAVRLRVEHGFDARLLREVLATLEGTS
jgi:hypothetical protein